MGCRSLQPHSPTPGLGRTSCQAHVPQGRRELGGYCSSSTHCLLPKVSRASQGTTNKQQYAVYLVLQRDGKQAHSEVMCNMATRQP